MFPVAEATLSLHDIAEYWSREIHPPASSDELLSLLVGAWWLGELRSNSRHSRLQLLKLMFKSTYKDDLRFVFVVGDAEVLELPNGSLNVHLYEVHVPSNNTNSWTEAACKQAFLELAQMTKESLFKRYREYAVLLPSIELTFKDFDAWRSKCGYSRPKFWGPKRTKSKRGRPPATTRLSVRQAREAVVPAVIAEALEHGASDAVRKRRHGPEPGTFRRYEAADRELFPEVEQIMAKKQKSRSAAALDLAQTGRIAGVGTPESRAKRLAALHKRERGGAQ